MIGGRAPHMIAPAMFRSDQGTHMIRLAALLLAVCPQAACSRGAVPTSAGPVVEEHFSDPVAVVNGLAIYESTYEQILIAMRDKIPENHPDGVEQYLGAKFKALEKAIDEELLYQEAIRRGYGISEAEARELFDERARNAGGEEAYLRGALVQRLSKSEVLQNINRSESIKKFVQREIEAGISATEDQVRAFYDARPDLFTPDPWVELGQIFVSAPIGRPVPERSEALSRISAALEQLHKGRSFESVAQDVSEEAAAEFGGKLGLFKKGNLPPVLDRAAFSLVEGGVTGIVESDVGYHILKVYGRKGGRLAPYIEVKEKVREELLKKIRADRLISLIATLKESAKIERLIT